MHHLASAGLVDPAAASVALFTPTEFRYVRLLLPDAAAGGAEG